MVVKESEIIDLFDNPLGDPYQGDCMTYAVALVDYYDGDGIFCVYVPDYENFDTLHAAAIIEDNIYDARGKVRKEKLIGEQMMVMRRKYQKYIHKNDINNSLTQHLDKKSKTISSQEAKDYNMYNPKLYEKIMSNLNNR